MIILLDLNYTLVANSTEKKRPFAMQIQHEKYREWLVSLVAPYHTILMTARPEMHRQATLDSIYFKVGWTPQEAHFNRYHKPPHDAKRIMLEQHVFPKHGGLPIRGFDPHGDILPRLEGGKRCAVGSNQIERGDVVAFFFFAAHAE
jgi:hypothetical protein